MHDAAIVGVRKRVGRLDPVSNGVFHRERTAIDEITQRTAIDVFHRDKRQAAGFAHLVDSADVRVIERGRVACLAEQLRIGLVTSR